jgi:hypothetical protein
VSTFWKPVHTPPSDPFARTKKLGNGLYVLWSRCDVCHISGPFHTMSMVERGEEHGTLCATCIDNVDLLLQLRQDGWMVI